MGILIALLAIAGLYGLWRCLRDELDREILAQWRHEAPWATRSERAAIAAEIFGRREMYGTPQPHST
jgi:hypothetical protein